MHGVPLAAIGAMLGEVLQRKVNLQRALALGGGCIHRAYRLADGDQDWFLKLGDAGRNDMFAAEADGLAALARAPLRVPRVICRGETAGRAFLVLEWLTLVAGTPRAYASLGEQLARTHAVVGARFGWHRDNFIGATPQPNTTDDSWPRFFCRWRLAPQFALAKENGHAQLCAEGEALLQVLPALFGGYAPRPSLLHGDLWCGNAGFTAGGTPAVFDPAVYYGDREADLAMTELFGGFPRDFYAAYRAHAPLDPGYRVRKTLYNLYHVINHANLFGGGYAAQAQEMIAALLAEA